MSGSNRTPSRGFRFVRWVVTVVVVGVVLLIASGATYEAISRERVAREFPPVGRLIDIGSRRIQLDCQGTGSPIVVLETGLDWYGSRGWTSVQGTLTKITRTCSYSRAGIMWSDPAPEPRDGKAIAADLHATLSMAGEKPPYVLVGQSLGAVFIMIYTQLYPAQVSALVFVDGSHPDQLQRFAVVAATPNLAAGPSYRKRLWVGRMGLIRLLGPSLPNTAPRSEREVYAYGPTSSVAAYQEEEAIPATFAEANGARNLGARPLYVLTATMPYSPEVLAAWGLTAEQGRKHLLIQQQLGDDQASWSTISHHELIADSDHFIELHRPDSVVTGVTWVLDRVRRTPN